jgi:hypothetical protein
MRLAERSELQVIVELSGVEGTVAEGEHLGNVPRRGDPVGGRSSPTARDDALSVC